MTAPVNLSGCCPSWIARVSNLILLSNLKIKIHGWYIETGHVRDEKDHFQLREYFESELRKVRITNLSVTEEIYLGLFAPGSDTAMPAGAGLASIHTAPWPEPDPALEDEQAEAFGGLLVQIATAVRRYKSEHSLALGSELRRLQLAPVESGEGTGWAEESWLAAIPDIKGVTRAQEIELAAALDPALMRLPVDGPVRLAIQALTPK